MKKPVSQPIVVDPNAASADPALPGFLARPDGAPVYHGFPLMEETRTPDGWCFGMITGFDEGQSAEYGDAFVVAPDGSRAGLVWEVGEGEISVIRPPEPGRWGVYAVWLPGPIKDAQDLAAAFAALLPHLRRIYENR